MEGQAIECLGEAIEIQAALAVQGRSHSKVNLIGRRQGDRGGVDDQVTVGNGDRAAAIGAGDIQENDGAPPLMTVPPV
ncbi:MAG: hypothetical protein WDN28_29190 [Chthoniobacter sp.]